MLLNKIIFVLFFFFAGFFITALVSFVVIFIALRQRKAKDGGSLLTIGAAALGGIGGVIAGLVGIVLVFLDDYQWLRFGSVFRSILYVMAGLMVIGFLKGIVDSIRDKSSSRGKTSKKDEQ